MRGVAVTQGWGALEVPVVDDSVLHTWKLGRVISCDVGGLLQ